MIRSFVKPATKIESQDRAVVYENSLEEAQRRRIVTLIFIIYWLLIFEGALRKWAFPQFHQVLFYVRDPFVLLTYWLALKYRVWPRPSPLLLSGIILSLLSLIPIVFQLFGSLGSIVIYGYGWRNYFFYIPLAFIMGDQLRAADLRHLVKYSLLVALPIAVLVFVQFFSPAENPINSSLIEGGLVQAGVIEGVIRTYGTFTSSSGQTPFVASLVAMLLASWIIPAEQRPFKRWLLLLISGAVLTNLALSGSRGAFLHSGLMLVLAIVAALVLSHDAMRARTLTLTLVLTVIGGILIPLLFPTAFDAIVERSTGAYAVEDELYNYGTVGRIVHDVIHFTELMPDTPLLGYGLGFFGNAYSESASKLISSSNYVEDDWSRNIVELGPMLGLLYIFLRLALACWLIMGAIKATSRSNNPLPLLLAGFTGVIVVYGQLTGHGSVNGYGWLFVGFCMAANKMGQTPAEESHFD